MHKDIPRVNGTSRASTESGLWGRDREANQGSKGQLMRLPWDNGWKWGPQKRELRGRSKEKPRELARVLTRRNHSELDGWECGRGNVCRQREGATGRVPGKWRLRCFWDGVGLRTRYVRTERWTRASMGAEDCRWMKGLGLRPFCGP